jgi:hypothetical protein
MHSAALPAHALTSTSSDAARRLLMGSAAAWYVVAVIGQLIFASYVAIFYGSAVLAGDFERWNRVMPHGYVAGDTLGNVIVLAHLVFAAVIVVGGIVQVTTGTQRWVPTLHRWNGRLYIVAVFVMGIGGLTMAARRGAVGDATQTFAIAFNAVLMMIFAVMVLRHALARRFDQHRRWALRLFLAVSGVWFFRIALMFWILVNRGPVGFDPETFRGPALIVIAFGQYLVPLAVLELYFRARDRGGPRVQITMATGLSALTLLTATGIVAATLMMWVPRL